MLGIALFAACTEGGRPGKPVVPDPSTTTPTGPTGTTPTGTTPIPTETTTSPTVTICTGVPPEVVSLAVTPRADLVTAADLSVTLDAEASIAVRCTRADDPSEVLLYTADPAVEHELALHGLAASTRYDCELVATCPASAGPEAFSLTTLAVPSDLPEVEVSTPSAVSATTAPPFLLLGHDRHCVGDTPRMLVYDTDGELRWYYDDVPSIDIAFETQYLGAGEFAFGGGFYDGAPPQELDVDQDILYTVGSPNAQSHLFHHDGKLLPSGQMLLMMIQEVSDGSASWDGFAVGLVDPATDADTFFYSSQTAVDAGDLPSGYGDPWHANWADYQVDPVNGDRLYVSLCNLGEIIAIDAASQQVVWTFGADGDFDLQYPNGTTPKDDVAWPQCEHGLEFVPFAGGGGGNLLVYDNGAHGRGYSRLVEYALDEATMEATLLWTYTEPVWMEPSWGDIDYLPGGHVLGTMGHACWSPYPNDVSSVVEVDPATGEVPWRLDFTSSVDAIYRSERIDACDIFPIVGFCPDVAANLDLLLPLFDPCAYGVDADQDGDGAFLCADGDCDDLDPTVLPGATEGCDGVDQDCDGEIDEGFAQTEWYPDADADGFGAGDPVLACAAPPGYAAVDQDCDDGQPAAFPGGVEVCDGVDDDCNGKVDELTSCWSCTASGAFQACAVALPWDDARQVCQDLGGDLATLADRAENDDVGALAGGEAWIGLDDQAVEGDFTWVDGAAPSFGRWYPGEPNDFGGNEDCAGINYGFPGAWNDYDCANALPFVCEL